MVPAAGIILSLAVEVHQGLTKIVGPQAYSPGFTACGSTTWTPVVDQVLEKA